MYSDHLNSSFLSSTGDDAGYRQKNIRLAILYFTILIFFQAAVLFWLYYFGARRNIPLALFLGVLVAFVLPIVLSKAIFGWSVSGE